MRISGRKWLLIVFQIIENQEILLSVEVEIAKEIFSNSTFRRRSAAKFEYEAQRCFVYRGSEEWDLVTRNGLRERGKGNQDTIVQESILDSCNHSANPSFTADTALLFGKDFPGEFLPRQIRFFLQISKGQNSWKKM